MEAKDFLKRLTNLLHNWELVEQFNQDRAKAHGEHLKKDEEIKQKQQSSCNHLKGGYCEIDKETKKFTGKLINAESVGVGGYAVIKHKFHWGDIWVRCLRCNKQWKPGDEGYAEALAFPTQNTMSTSGYDWVIIDRKPIQDVARELTKSSK